MSPLSKSEAFEIIRRLEVEIRVLGGVRLALFGSVARGEAKLETLVYILV